MDKMNTNKSAEQQRLEENSKKEVPLEQWGPYLSERQWGTVREDYSEEWRCMELFSSRSCQKPGLLVGRRWIGGISDIFQNLCFAIALWNGKDPILKERLFGLSNDEGNHGEDVKELYYYLDNIPTHYYMKYLYKYPQEEFPYDELIDKNRHGLNKNQNMKFWIQEFLMIINILMYLLNMPKIPVKIFL